MEWTCLLLATPFLLFAAPARAPLLLVIPALWLLRRLSLGRFVPCTPVDLPVLVLMVMGGVGFCVSPDPAWSQMKINALLLGIGFLYATVDLLEPAERLHWVPAGVIVLGLAFLGLGLLGTRWALKVPRLGALTVGLPGELAWLPEGETYFNPNVIGGALLWVLPLSLSLFLWAMRRRARRWEWAATHCIVIALDLGLLVLTQSRGAWLGLATGLLVLLAVVGGRMGRTSAILFLITLLVLTTLDPAKLGQSDLVDAVSPYVLSTVTIQQRLEVWSRAYYAIADFPLTGPGLDVFQYVMPVMYPLFRTQHIRLIPHAHNEFLQVALDLGLPGLIAWQALYMLTFWVVWQVYRRSRDGLIKALALGSGGALVAHLVYAMTDSGVLDAKPNIVFWMIVGLSIALHQSLDQAPAK